MRPCNDPRLHELAKTFHQLDEFPDEGCEFENMLVNLEVFRHYSIMPGGRMIGVRFFLKGRNRYIAYAPCKRQKDLLRFADMATLRFWKYFARSRHRPVENCDVNFSPEMAQRDLEELPEVVEFLDAIEQHFLSIGVLTDVSKLSPDAARDTRKHKTVRMEFLNQHQLQLKMDEQRHQELLDALGAVVEQLDGMAKRLDALESNTVKIHSFEFPKDPPKLVTLPTPKPAAPEWVPPTTIC